VRILRKNQRLNKVEKIKLERHPLEVRRAIIETYSKDLLAMDEVPGEVERLKWVGIYPQKQGGDAFMMRIKVPGGVLKPEQAKVIGKIAADFANGPVPNPHFGDNFLDLTTRQDVQMHWLIFAGRGDHAHHRAPVHQELQLREADARGDPGQEER
jgi:ferredoxin-nitrite reductase